MDIEQLSKSQIILLTLLVSFVTSIATGIVTVSLMEQAPPAVAQTVNRVIERTVEKVVPGQQAAAAAVTKEKTVVVKESDLIAQALQKVNPSIVRLYTSSTENPAFIGLGIIIDAAGTIATDDSILGERGDAVVELQSGMRVRSFVSARHGDSGIAILDSATTSVDAKIPVWKPITFAGDHTTLGETIVTISGKSIARIAEGIITAVYTSGGEGSPQVIETDIDTASIMPGSPLINTDGNLVGVSTWRARASHERGFIESASLMKKSE